MTARFILHSGTPAPANRQRPSLRIGVQEWVEGDGIARMIGEALSSLGHQPVFFQDRAVPQKLDLVLTFGPFGPILELWEHCAELNYRDRPAIIHWNTEGLPNFHLPLSAMRFIGSLRSSFGRLMRSASHRLPILARFDQYMIRERYFGDYGYAARKGWLTTLADSSQIYKTIHHRRGIPSAYLPWGSSPSNFAQLDLERDIDVLWIGKLGSARRSRIIDRVRDELRAHGIEVYMADNRENPFIFGELRTEFLNRSKITLNIARTWYDDNYSRFALAVPNRSLIVSEPLLPHCPEYRPDLHYISVPVEEIAGKIVYYLKNDRERKQIVENAYEMVTNDLRLSDWIGRLLKQTGFAA